MGARIDHFAEFFKIHCDSAAYYRSAEEIRGFEQVYAFCYLVKIESMHP